MNEVSSCTDMVHYIIRHVVVNHGYCSWSTTDLERGGIGGGGHQ